MEQVKENTPVSWEEQRQGNPPEFYQALTPLLLFFLCKQVRKRIIYLDFILHCNSLHYLDTEAELQKNIREKKQTEKQNHKKKRSHSLI